ncbi:MAG: hypothetical protein Q8K75_07580 [Chlamydiales bacterium]|nr:hypothetical protein [Chlamydiales bacterium]
MDNINSNNVSFISSHESKSFEIANDANTEAFETVVLEENTPPVASGESQSYARWMWEGMFHSHKVASQVTDSQPAVIENKENGSWWPKTWSSSNRAATKMQRVVDANMNKITESCRVLTDLHHLILENADNIRQWTGRELAESTVGVQENQASVEYAQGNVDLYRAELSELKAIVHALRSGDIQLSITALDNRREALNVRLSETEAQLERAKQGIVDLTANLPNLEGEYIQGLRVQIEGLKPARDKAYQTHKSEPTEESRAMCDRLQGELDGLSSRVRNEMPEAAKDAHDAIKGLKQDRETLEGKIRVLTSSVEQVQGMVQEVNQGYKRKVRKTIEAQIAKTEPRLETFEGALLVAKAPLLRQERANTISQLLQGWLDGRLDMLQVPDFTNATHVDVWVQQAANIRKQAVDVFKQVPNLVIS